MKKSFLLAAVSVTMLTFGSCSGTAKSDNASADSTKNEGTGTSETLVAYYSATGTTEKAAKEISEATGGTLYAIEPVKPYTDADLDYENKESRSAVENANPDMRPEIKKGLDIAPYETVYLGFPVWWDKAPLVVYTFLDSYDFTGKKIVVFATAHSSGLKPSYDALVAAYPNYTFESGDILNVTNGDGFDAWVNSLKK